MLTPDQIKLAEQAASEMPEVKPLITRWFSFGFGHAHAVNGITFDKDCLVEITSTDPRQTMFDTFGCKWAMEYDETRKNRALHYYKRGVIVL